MDEAAYYRLRKQTHTRLLGAVELAAKIPIAGSTSWIPTSRLRSESGLDTASYPGVTFPHPRAGHWEIMFSLENPHNHGYVIFFSHRPKHNFYG